MKRWSSSYVTREMQAARVHNAQIRVAKSQTPTTVNAGKGLGHQTPRALLLGLQCDCSGGIRLRDLYFAIQNPCPVTGCRDSLPLLVDAFYMEYYLSL